ncbi:MAG TPA: c-type cytochrome [Planctomycetes bacterium]|nr:c-type cytochrome [Fuerstiella sp.]HIK91801.1 c-type cytochrome [Planctomycetota bacterium]
MRFRINVQICLAAVCVAMLLLSGTPVSAQDSPDESLKTLDPAEGLEVSLWASEPMVSNPTAMDIDSRGRVWVAEGLNYRMKQKQFDTLKRVDGADRIKILCDTDGDGKADTVTVFADNIFPVPLGLAVEEIRKDGKQTGTRVYVGNSPDLLVLEDTDGDDKADRRYALLTGFRGVDSDHGLHGMTFGPDGKLYFTVGDARYGADRVQAREKTFDVTDKSGRRLSASNFGTTLRVNRDGTQLEVLSSGHRNNYEAAVDSFGNVFASDNDDDGNRGCRMFWVMEGGAYGYQHPDSSRHWAEELPGIIPKLVGTGNGAPGGLTVYEGDMLPKRYFGAVLQIDSGTHQVNAHPLHRHGAGFRSDYDVLLKGHDTWFRPVDLTVAPDGSVFVCDWYDAGVGGNRFSDQTTGRIYRLRATDDRRSTTKLTVERPIEGLQSPNGTTRLAAREQLLSEGPGARSELLKLFRSGRPQHRARALHVLYDLPGTGIDDTTAALSDSDARIRETALQLLARDATLEFLVDPDRGQSAKPPANAMLNQILPLADDEDAGVRRALLMALRNVPTKDAGEALGKMAESWDGRDRYYLEALRATLVNRESNFVQQLFDDLADRAMKSAWSNATIAVPPYYPTGTNNAFLRPEDQLPPSNAASRISGLAWVLQRAESLPALQRMLKQNQSPSVEHATLIALAGIRDIAAGELLMQRYSADAISDDHKRDVLRRLGKGVAGPWHGLAKGAALRNVFIAALEDPQLQAAAVQAIARARLSEFGDQLMNLARNESHDDIVRAAAISSLGQMKHKPVRKLATRFVDHAKGKRSGGLLAISSLNAVHALVGDDAQKSLSEALVDSSMPLDVRRRSLQLITTSVAGVDRVLSLHKASLFPNDLASELSFLLHNHADRRVRDRAKKELPINTGGAGKKIHEVQAVLALQGNASRGRDLFLNHKEAACARCHRVTGEGTLVGPDLASIGTKYGDKELLYHIQYPSGAISYNFVARTFLLNDGRLLNGLVVDRKDGQIILGIATGKYVTFATSDVEEEFPQTVSLMAEGLVANLTEQQLCDLIEYLLTLRQGDAVRVK